MDRSSRRLIRHSTYMRIATLNLFFQALIVVTGATVRLTGSGLGCSHWPQCTETRTLPAMDFHALIEFGNRIISLPLTLVAIAACIGSWKLSSRRSDLRWGSGLVLLGVITQIVVGGLSVIYELPPLLVSAHFLISIAILGAATWTWHASRSEVPLQLRIGSSTALLAVVMLLSAAAVITAGVMTTAGGPFSGAEARGIVERFGNWQLAVTVHARGAYVFAALVIALTLWARRSRAGVRDLGILTGIITVQIILGEIQYRTDLPRGVVLAHIANATIMWIMTCLIAWRACAPHATDSHDRQGDDDELAAGHGRAAARFDTVRA